METTLLIIMGILWLTQAIKEKYEERAVQKIQTKKKRY